jgi:hypothetical protein
MFQLLNNNNNNNNNEKAGNQPALTDSTRTTITPGDVNHD